MVEIFVLASLSLGGINSAQNLNVAQRNLQNLNQSYAPLASEVCQNPALRKVDLVKVQDIYLNRIFSLQIKGALTQANQAGYKMGIESAFRPCAEQQQLRQQNCPSAETPAAGCRPPTEKAGQSLHNYGLAVDFKCTGYLKFGDSPCYAWLKSNASKFKLQQRPEEPWHWSLTGQ